MYMMYIYPVSSYLYMLCAKCILYRLMKIYYSLTFLLYPVCTFPSAQSIYVHTYSNFMCRQATSINAFHL